MEAAPGLEPGMTDLQSVALATWPCRLLGPRSIPATLLGSMTVPLFWPIGSLRPYPVPYHESPAAVRPVLSPLLLARQAGARCPPNPQKNELNHAPSAVTVPAGARRKGRLLEVVRRGRRAPALKALMSGLHAGTTAAD